MTNKEIIAIRYKESVQGIKGEWLTNNGTEWYDYIVKLPVELRVTYLIIVLNSQVFNGGFHQYFTNTYGQFSKETIDSLLLIGAYKKSDLLNKAFKLVNAQKYSDEVFRLKLLTFDFPELFKNDSLSDPLDKLDDQYYDETDEEILEELLGRFLLNYDRIDSV